MNAKSMSNDARLMAAVGQVTTYRNMFSTGEGQFRASGLLKIALGLVWALCGVAFFAMVSMMQQVSSKTVLQQPVVQMLYAFEPVREAAQACHRGGAPIGQCAGVPLLMPQSTAQVSYQLTEQGQLLGIDYRHHVMILLSPRIEGESLHWACRGQPVAKTAQTCHYWQAGL